MFYLRSLLLVLALFLPCAGCGPVIGNYSLASLPSRDGRTFEDGGVRIRVAILDDRRYGLDILNKTDKPLRITWMNSTAVCPSGRTDAINYRVTSGRCLDDGRITTVGPGASISAEAYPRGNFKGRHSGSDEVFPLYCDGRDAGKPSSVEGKAIGLKIVMEVDDHTLLYPVMLRVGAVRRWYSLGR